MTIEEVKTAKEWHKASKITTIEDALQAMAQHSKDNPTHGYNCACKDKFLHAARKSFMGLSKEARNEASYLFHTLVQLNAYLPY